MSAHLCRQRQAHRLTCLSSDERRRPCLGANRARGRSFGSLPHDAVHYIHLLAEPPTHYVASFGIRLIEFAFLVRCLRFCLDGTRVLEYRFVRSASSRVLLFGPYLTGLI
ncbi:hypothetical protein MRX96_035549 [Rhipicephalus microplus]